MRGLGLDSRRLAHGRVTCSAHRRRGLTLLEVLLSLGIFLIAMTAISQLVALGTRASLDARLEAEAALRAETALHEVLAGVQPMQSVEATPFEDDPDWQWTLTVSEGPHIDLLRLDVAAFRQESGGQPRNSVRITRLVRNPDLFLDAALT
ncbi:MAG: prepilin-type N-terminal cleavage/methylation domain-containing protein, partial [Planctomycetaceae bacterium]|nr:prepilin-type N-terminal cleavage/methylation domain-containing protein [Planctomycetaceae bacterium]